MNTVFSRSTLLLLPALFLLLSCGGGGSNSSSLGRTNTMVVHALSDLTGMNPINTVGAQTTAVQELVFDKLLALDFETYDIRPTVTDELPEISGDKLTYTFKLRNDIVFSDGTPMTADDIVFSFKATMNPFVDSAPVRAELHNFIDCIKVDKLTVELKLSDSGPKNLDKLAINFFILPKHIYDKGNLTDGYTSTQGVRACENRDAVDPIALDKMKTFGIAFDNEKFQRTKEFVIGSGRYTFDGWNTGQMIRLVKNKNYWKAGSGHDFDQQNMDTIILKTINDLETAFIALKSGDIDFSDQFKASQVAEKMNSDDFKKNFKVQTIPYPFYEYIGWNTRIKDQPNRNFFADKRVRTALSHLVDVDEIISQIMYNTAIPITSMVFYKRPEYAKNLEVIKYNEQKAQALLYQAGWEDLDGDGFIEKEVNGVTVPFSFKLYYRQGQDVRKNIALIVKKNLEKAGIRVEPIALDWSVMLEKLKRKELDAWIGAWVYDSNEQDFYQLFHSSQIENEGFNWTCYSNPEADRLMEKIYTEWDQDKRFDLHRKVQEIIYDDQPYTLLFANMARIAYNNRMDTKKFYGQRPCYDLPQFKVVKPSPN
ncbi:MAG: hypothetical protein H6581_00275 [Bacteroidia bacterium]|nr:hypothetical protein [Bacteroidia bacterium]